MTKKAKGKKPAKNITPPKQGVAELVSALPDKQFGELIQVVSKVTKVETFSGPLPPPDALKKYDQTLPGAAKRIMTMAETEQRGRLAALERQGERQEKALSNDAKRINGAILLGALLIVIIIPLAMLGYPWQGVLLGFAGTLNIIARQLGSRRDK